MNNDLVTDSEWHECDFEMESLCGWTIDPSPPGFPFNWERTNSKLLEDQNVDGPKHDHSDEKQSKYVSIVNEVMYFFCLPGRITFPWRVTFR